MDELLITLTEEELDDLIKNIEYGDKRSPYSTNKHLEFFDPEIILKKRSERSERSEQSEQSERNERSERSEQKTKRDEEIEFISNKKTKRDEEIEFSFNKKIKR